MVIPLMLAAGPTTQTQISMQSYVVEFPANAKSGEFTCNLPISTTINGILGSACYITRWFHWITFLNNIGIHTNIMSTDQLVIKNIIKNADNGVHFVFKMAAKGNDVELNN